MEKAATDKETELQRNQKKKTVLKYRGTLV